MNMNKIALDHVKFATISLFSYFVLWDGFDHKKKHL